MVKPLYACTKEDFDPEVWKAMTEGNQTPSLSLFTCLVLTVFTCTVGISLVAGIGHLMGVRGFEDPFFFLR